MYVFKFFYGFFPFFFRMTLNFLFSLWFLTLKIMHVTCKQVNPTWRIKRSLLRHHMTEKLRRQDQGWESVKKILNAKSNSGYILDECQIGSGLNS